MKRILFTAASALSLLLLLAVIVAWVRSYSGITYITYSGWTQPAVGSGPPRVRDRYGILTRAGKANFGRFWFWNPGKNTPLQYRWKYERPPRSSQFGAIPPHSFLGFGYGNQGSPLYSVGLRVPLWFITALLGVLPLTWLVRVFRHRRRDPHACRICGYDLRASNDRCPECGTLIPPDAKPCSPVAL